MQTYGTGGGIAPSLLTTVIDGFEWAVSLHSRFASRSRAPATNGIGCVGSREDLEVLEKRQNLAPVENRITAVVPYSPTKLFVPILTELSGLQEMWECMYGNSQVRKS
jgi:hypothetical protein